MTLTVVWSVQARNQFLATLTYIAKEDPQSAELVHERVEKSLKPLCNSPNMGVLQPMLSDPSGSLYGRPDWLIGDI